MIDERVCRMIEFYDFYGLRPLDKAEWTSEKQSRCAGAQFGFRSDSQSSSASLKKLKLGE